MVKEGPVSLIETKKTVQLWGHVQRHLNPSFPTLANMRALWVPWRSPRASFLLESARLGHPWKSTEQWVTWSQLAWDELELGQEQDKEDSYEKAPRPDVPPVVHVSMKDAIPLVERCQHPHSASRIV